MEPSAPQVFSGISPEQYAKLQAKAQASGVALSGNSGTTTQFGVEISWNYAPGKQELTLHCLRTPLFVSSAEVNAKLQALVKNALAEA